MQNTVWGKNVNTDSKKEEKKDEYKPDIRLQRLWKSLEENERKLRHEKFQNWLEENQDYGENSISVNDILNHFCRDVFNQLPLEFAAEADKLLALKLEGSVG